MKQDLDLSTRLARARLVVLDVDGVMTDGRVVYAAGRHSLLQLTTDVFELQFFDVQDGIALHWLSRSGIKLAWITGRGGEVTERRARELKVDTCLMGVEDKAGALEQVQREMSLTPAETVAMGDDLPDLGLRARADFFVAPDNARPEVKERADFVTRARGGAGAVRELAEAILRAQGRWQGIVDAAGR